MQLVKQMQVWNKSDQDLPNPKAWSHVDTDDIADRSAAAGLMPLVGLSGGEPTGLDGRTGWRQCGRYRGERRQWQLPFSLIRPLLSIAWSAEPGTGSNPASSMTPRAAFSPIYN